MNKVSGLSACWRAVALVGSVAAFQPAFAAAPELGPFNDVPRGHWAREAVDSLAAWGLINGYADARFRGNQPMSRYEVAIVVQRILNQPLQRDPVGAMFPRQPTTARAPVDVPASHWAVDAVAMAHEWGLLIGDPGAIFAGDRPVSRGEFIILLHRLRTAAVLRMEKETGRPADRRPPSPPISNPIFRPNRRLTRYEFCVGMDRLIKNLQQLIDATEPMKPGANHSAAPEPGAGQMRQNRRSEGGVLAEIVSQVTRTPTYTLCAETPGQFHALPSYGYAMFTPEIRTPPVISSSASGAAVPRRPQ